MERVFVKADSVLTPLGLGTDINYRQLNAGISALKKFPSFRNFQIPFCAGILENFEHQTGYTRLETMLILVLEEVLSKADFSLSSAESLLIITSTKGNIEVLETGEFNPSRAYLPLLSKTIGSYFACKNEPLIISNACVSGVSALILAGRLIASKQYKHVVVCAADTFSEFVLSGFHCFNALSPEPCQPFDAERSGINLGEAAAALILSSEAEGEPSSELLPGYGSNDANHISGPSRTGEGLYRCATKTLEHFGETPSFISAHGTATPYNDEMEAVAFQRLGLSEVPTHSLKGYFGHTLGAAGLLEFILSNRSLHENRLLVSKGYEYHGVSVPLKVITEALETPLRSFMKTASGFGGTNAAIICRKCRE